jgi:hypothetical protein
MVPFTSEKETKIDDNTIHYINMRFCNYNSDTVYSDVYYYKDKKVFWIKETDETLTWTMI